MYRSIEAVVQWLTRVVTQPLEELNRWQAAVRFAYDLGRFGTRQLKHDRAHQMAAALSFHTLFGLLPVLVVATVLVRAMGMEENYLEPLGRLFAFWGLDRVQIVPPVGGEASTTLAVWLGDRVREAERVNVAAIGWVGVAVTIYAAISLMVTIENCFNLIYRASQGRPWTSRVPVYWFVLTISPMLIIFSAFVDGQVRQFMGTLRAQGWVGSLVGLAWSVLVIWLLMFALYTLFPNARVRVRPALIGALVAAVLLEIGKRTMGVYLQNALTISQLYGSLGLVPLFMFWVYLMWLAVLFGLQVSSTLQHLRGRRLAELESRQVEATITEPGIVTLAMKQIAEQFTLGRDASVDTLADDHGVPQAVMERIVEQLTDRGLVHRVANAESRVTLSQPPESIRVARLLEVGYEMVNHDQADSPLIERLRTAQLQSVGNSSLRDLIT